MVAWVALLAAAVGQAGERAIAAVGPVPQVPWYTKAAPKLPWPAGPVVEVRDAGGLMNAVNNNPAPGTTILIHDGTYFLPDVMWLRNIQRVALRSHSGNRDKVILDASKSKHEDMLWIWHCDDVLIADLTFQNARVHGIAVKGESDTQRTRIYNCVFHNIWERKIKGTSAATASGQPAKSPDPHVLATRPANGRIEYCLFFDDHKKNVDDFANGDYIAGIDMMWLKNWVVSDNVFLNIQGRNGLARGAIFLWNNCEDVLVERNLILNCDRGICIGNPSGSAVHMTRGIVRNNMILRGADCGMEIVKTVDTQVYNNTVWGQNSGYRQALQVKMGTGSCQVFNNLVRGVISIEEQGSREENNQTGALDGYFVDPAIGNLHLTATGLAAAQSRSLRTPKEFLDWDGGLRPAQPALGADETATTAAKQTASDFPAGGATPSAGVPARPATAVVPVTTTTPAVNPDRERTVNQTRATAIELLTALVPQRKGLKVTLDYKNQPSEVTLRSADVKDGLQFKLYGAARVMPWKELSSASLAGLLQVCAIPPAASATLDDPESPLPPPPADCCAAIALLYAIDNQAVAAAQAMQKAVDQDPELKDPLKTALALLR